jgi:hypothetical protein
MTTDRQSGWLLEAITTVDDRRTILAWGKKHHDACPCFEVEDGDIHLAAHCWRGECPQGCTYCGLHTRGIDRVTGEKLVALLWADRHSAWDLVVEDEA